MDVVRIDSHFGVADGLTPGLAAQIAQCASNYSSRMSIAMDGREIQIESLISILSMELRRGRKLTIIAEGADAHEAAASLKMLLEE